MPERVRIAVQFHPQHAEYVEIRRAVLEAEALGVDIVYNWDHFFPLYGDGDGRHFECWTMLGSWAEITQRVEIGALVTCNSYRNPDLLADMARTVDHASNGRLILGIGAGWYRRDYDEYGYVFGTPGSRLAELGRALTRIKARFAKLNPPPTRPIPILIGGGGERKTLRFTARHADIWHGFGSPEVLHHKNEVLNRWCAEIGRNPAEIERSIGVDPRKPERAESYLAAGANQITMGLGGPRYDLAPVREWVAWRDRR